jgi:hypothetical protein
MKSKLQALINASHPTLTLTLTLTLMQAFRIVARATDEEARVQPMVTPGWNPKGYMSNAVMNVDVTVTVNALLSAPSSYSRHISA